MKKTPITDADVVKSLETAVELAGGLRAWGRQHQFTASYVSDIINGRRNPSERLARAVGFVRVQGWEVAT